LCIGNAEVASSLATRKLIAFLAEGWPVPERPAVQQEDIVQPGGTATFSFSVKGILPGTFVVPLRGVIDGGAWMDDLGMYTVVTVRSARTARTMALSFLSQLLGSPCPGLRCSF